jgi:hypothetical protein
MRNTIEIKARELMPGDIIITQSDGTFYEFEVDSDGVTFWDRDRPGDQVRAAVGNDSGVFWFHADEPVIIEDFKTGLFPLADIRQRRYASNPGLERHFQMAGAVDQDTVERLAVGMRYTARTGRGWNTVRAGAIRFLCADGCTNTLHLNDGRDPMEAGGPFPIA